MNRRSISNISIFRGGVCAAVCAAYFLSVPASQAQTRTKALPTRHVREAVTRGQARLLSSLPTTQTMRLAMMLPLRNEADLDALIEQVYDPESPLYHQYLSVEDFTQRFGPSESDVASVVEFAQSNGMNVEYSSENRLLVTVTAPVATVERAFHVKMSLYQHPHEPRSFYSADREPTISDPSVRLHHISGLDNYSIPTSKTAIANESSSENATVAKGTGSGTGGAFIASDMRAAYYGGTALTGSGQAIGLFEFGPYNVGAVSTYLANVKQTSTVAINAVSVDGSAATCSTTCNDSEHILDIIQAISMAPGLSQVRVYVANTAPGTTDVEIFNKMATENIAKQLSCSWGWSPADPNSDDPIFKQFAAQGQTLFVASGDAGAYKSTTLNVYPADDPYVTAVGGTILTTVAAGGAWKSETAWACVSGSTMCGGGGISPNKIAIPSWQTTTGVITKTNLGSTTYRNLPDVAAEANTDNYICYGYNNSTKTATCGSTWGGTSFSAPRWAGILALANQQALSHKDSFTDALLTTTKTTTCGFINPALYAAGLSSKASTYFHDITSGSIGTFSAITGFDLVTGWGSPIGSALITLLAP